MYIQTQDDLAAFAHRASNSSLLAIDTEFLREKTYYAKLCLIQIATDDEIVLVDPLRIASLDALAPLFTSPTIMKIFHAGRQDIELLYDHLGVIPSPLFDTQIAAALLGYSQQIGYGNLVSALCGEKLKKSDAFTDWSLRPLSDSQLNYAREDVLFLPDMYTQMRQKLEHRGRLNWLNEDFDELANLDNYVIDPFTRYRHLAHGSSLNRKALAAARELAAWRETEARERNLPRKWVLTDEQIVEAARRNLYSIDELFMVRGIKRKITVPEARELIARVQKVWKMDPSTWPELERSSRHSEPNVDGIIDVLSSIVRLRAEENNIAFQTLASHSDLVNLARGHFDLCRCMHGWRRSLIGLELLDALHGKISISIHNNKVSLTHCATQHE